MGRQHVPQAGGGPGPGECPGEGGRGGHPPVPHRPPGDESHGRQGRGGLVGLPRRPVGGDHLHSGAPCDPQWTVPLPGHRRIADPRDRPGSGRRLRLQMHSATGGDRGGLAGLDPAQAVPLAGGSPRTSDRRRQHPRAPVFGDRLRRPARAAAGHGRGSHRGRGRLLGVAVHRRAGSGPGRWQPARPLRFPRVPLPGQRAGHQQAALHPLPGRGPARRVFRHGADHRRHRPGSRSRALGSARREPGAGGRHALCERDQQALRHRRLPGLADARQGSDPLRPGAGTAEDAGSGRPADRRRLRHLHRAIRPRQ